MEPLKTIRPELLTMSEEQIRVLMPYFVVFGGAIVAMLGSVLKKLSPKWPVFIITLATLFAGVWVSIGLIPEGPVTLFNGMMAADSFSNFFNTVFLLAAALSVMVSFRYLDREGLQLPEYNVLILFSVLGMMLLASALDFIVLFIALELMSLAVYVLVGFRRADRRSNEAAMKYFILGSAASAVLLYGTALLYGCTGTTAIKGVVHLAQAEPAAVTPVFVLGVAMVVFGFLFKVAAAPFHMWMPDVYEGAPVPVTGFMTTGLKAAAFAAFFRVFINLGLAQGATEVVQRHFHDIFWVCAVLTMVIGNFVALTQTNLKRMLAYSSIAHTGYLLVGFVTGTRSELGFAAGTMYVVAYAIMNLGAFAVLTLLSGKDDSGLNLHDLSGLSRRHPILAFALSVFLLSMAGIPPTAGFAAKYLLFSSAVQAGEISLVVIAVLCSAVSVYYYLRVLVYMYMHEPIGSPQTLRVSIWAGVAVAAMVVLTLQVGLIPERMVNIAKKAVIGM
ncbi:MAG: NADH-quinone oxidoreductase subunit N [Bdellovibrio sp.]|nr:NADH-quinone oxidoreductase subunit N [Bdellovibrio sp.]